MTTANNDLAKDVKLVHALMTLRQVSTQDLAVHTGVQLENLKAWLQGTPSALAHRSYVSLLSYLGLTRDGLSRAYVQNWKINATSSFNAAQLQAFLQVAPWLVGGAMIEIVGAWQPLHGKTRVFAIRGENFKVIVSIVGGFKIPLSIQPSVLPGISLRSTAANKQSFVEVDSLYWHAVRNQAITPAEFDDIFFETASKCSWNDLRLMARERGITPSMLAKEVLAREIEPSHVYAAEQTEVTIAAQTPASVSTPARVRRRASPEKVPVMVNAAAPATHAAASMSAQYPLSAPKASVPASAFQSD